MTTGLMAAAIPDADIMIAATEDSPMAQLVVRNFEEDVKARLQSRAKRHRRSMEEEVRDILRNAVGADAKSTVPLGSRLRDRFADVGLDGEIGAVRGGKARSAVFKR